MASRWLFEALASVLVTVGLLLSLGLTIMICWTNWKANYDKNSSIPNRVALNVRVLW